MVSELLPKAVALHQSGHLEEALALYNEVLKAAPKNADALHLAGLVQHQLGKNETAAELVGKAVMLQSQSALYLTNYAVILNVLSRFDEAESIAAKAIKIARENGMSWHCLGIAQLGKKMFSEAHKTLATAVSLDPDNAEFQNNLGTAHRNLNQNKLAVVVFKKAAGLDPNFATAHSNLAEALLSTGELDDAEKTCRDALIKFPEYAPFYLTLGRVLMNLSMINEAKHLFEKYLELHPLETKGYLALAGAENVLGEFSDALNTLEKAEKINSHSAEVIQMQGMLHLQLGDQRLAKKKLEEAVRLDPDMSTAYLELAQLRGVELTSKQQERLRQMLLRKDLAAVPKSVAAFTLARCEESAGDFAQAFAYLEEANKLRLEVLGAFGFSFNAAKFAADIEKTKMFFSSTFFVREQQNVASELPVFIIGLPRSGTTLVERIIASHTKAAGVGELTEIESIVSSLNSDFGAYPEKLLEIGESEKRVLSEQYLFGLQNRAPRALRIVDKNPFNFLHLGLIKTLFPNASVIHCRRDVRDVGLSCFMQNFADALPWTNSLVSIGNYINCYEKLMTHWQNTIGQDILTIDYEDVVYNLEQNARVIISHIGLEWDENCLLFHETKGGVQTASSVQVREPIYQRSAGRWKKYEEHLKPLLDVLN
jgi:tetratricopeptide (TPR) repeat protein